MDYMDKLYADRAALIKRNEKAGLATVIMTPDQFKSMCDRHPGFDKHIEKHPDQVTII